MTHFKSSSILLFLFVSILLVNCTKETPEKDNAFTYKSKIYKTPHGFNYSTYQSLESSIHYLAFSSPTLNYSKSQGFTGQGELIVLTFISNDSKELLPGTYYSGENLYPNVYLNYNIGGKEEHFSNTEKSTVNKAIITKLNNNRYEINYTLDYGNGKTFEGYFKGSFSPYNPFSK